MRIERDHLVFKALRALDEAVGAADERALEPSMHLRFVLAFLYAAGDAEKHWFDGLWTALISYPSTGKGSSAHYGRSQTITAALNAICRSVGMERDVALMEALRVGRG